MSLTALRTNAITIACSCGAALIFFLSFNQLFSDNKSLKNATTTTSATKSTPDVKQKQAHVKLTKYPLFGDYLAIQQTQDIPNTMLNLSLVGILKATDPNDSQAWIKVGSSDEKLYYLKDSLPGGAQLIRILDDAVLLRRNGQIERLSLPKNTLNTDAHEAPLQFEG
jgi:general secretion pathway protein C